MLFLEDNFAQMIVFTCLYTCTRFTPNEARPLQDMGGLLDDEVQSLRLRTSLADITGTHNKMGETSQIKSHENGSVYT